MCCKQYLPAANCMRKGYNGERKNPKTEVGLLCHHPFLYPSASCLKTTTMMLMLSHLQHVAMRSGTAQQQQQQAAFRSLDLHKHVASSPLAASFCVLCQTVVTSLRADGLGALASLQALAHKVYHLNRRYDARSSGVTSIRHVCQTATQSFATAARAEHCEGRHFASGSGCVPFTLASWLVKTSKIPSQAKICSSH